MIPVVGPNKRHEIAREGAINENPTKRMSDCIEYSDTAAADFNRVSGLWTGDSVRLASE